MKLISFTAIGILFGIVMTKSEAVSWYRIQEMFRFQSFHMYGIISVAVIIGAIGMALIRRYQLQTRLGTPIHLPIKTPGVTRYLAGGTLFGLGWALTGACPGPLYVLLGNGYITMLLVIAGALAGTLAYGILQPRLPH